MDQDNHVSRENARRAAATKQDNERRAKETRDENERIALLTRIGDLSRENQEAVDLFDERLSGFLGTNRTDGRCLGIIEKYKSMSAGQLANESGLTTGAVTAVIDRLEAAGYVRRERDPVDRRKIWIACTDELRAIVTEIFGFYDVIGPAMMKSFDAAQLQGILAFLRIGTRVNEEMAAALSENTKPGGTPAERVVQAKLFRRAIDAGAGRLTQELEQLAAPVPTTTTRSK
jgi:DNA-binding MarR family transcriptional regulator